jgi:hypothetical protein
MHKALIVRVNFPSRHLSGNALIRTWEWIHSSAQRKPTVVKNLIVAVALVFSAPGEGYIRSLKSVRANIATDGEHFVHSKMPSLSPEDSDTAWFHENTPLVKNDEAILDEVPATIRHCQKKILSFGRWLSNLQGTLHCEGWTQLVEMRLVASTYSIFLFAGQTRPIH